MSKKTERKIISVPYWSNCLFEAIKAKLKNFKKVKIITIAPIYNEVFCPHFMWTDGEYDYDFGTQYGLKGYELFWFQGVIRRYPLGWGNKYLCYRKHLYIKKKQETKRDMKEYLAKQKLHKESLKAQKKWVKEHRNYLSKRDKEVL